MHGILVLNDDEMDTAINSATDNDTAQKWTRSIQEKYYGLGPRDAYPGDEDQGQMSAWDVMSSIGLFQIDDGASVNPCYELGSPRFKKNDQQRKGEVVIEELRDSPIGEFNRQDITNT